MKIAPIIRAIEQSTEPIEYTLVHTGQHYDREMSDVFFDELGIPTPDHHFEAGGGSHAEQTAKIMVAYEKIVMASPPDWCVVVGDVNSTLACSIVAKKLGVRVAHVEAGLRSGDLAMPEEINRIVTDSISDLFFVTEPAGVENLTREGKPAGRIHFVGHVMIDNLFHQRDRLVRMDPAQLETTAIKRRLGRYGVVTLHRPSNVDDRITLTTLAGALNEIAVRLPLVFPVHPRTRDNLARFGIELSERIELTKPQSYMEFLNLWKDATVVLTDSGGLQEETTALGVPCVTLRENTERPVTLTEGTNRLAGTDPARIVEFANEAIAVGSPGKRRPALWDGHAATRTVESLVRAWRTGSTESTAPASC